MIPACKRWARRCEKLGSLFPRLQIRSNNSNGVSTLDTGFADPDMEAHSATEAVLGLIKARGSLMPAGGGDAKM
jgi:hypothetical protein